MGFAAESPQVGENGVAALVGCRPAYSRIPRWRMFRLPIFAFGVVSWHQIRNCFGLGDEVTHSIGILSDRFRRQNLAIAEYNSGP
jgi:hypothetical protein